jgi:hypothetical protein
MASPTTNKGYTYPAHGGAVNAWDTPLNDNFDQIDKNFGGVYWIECGSSIAGVTFNSTYATVSSTVSTVTFASSIAQNVYFPVFNALTQALTLVYPAVGSFYIISDQTSGGFAVKAKQASVATTLTVNQTELFVTDVDTAGMTAVIQTQSPEFASGTALLFPQAAPPSGWTIDATINDRVIRVNSAAGAGTGGSWTISGLTVGNTTLTLAQTPAHSHTVTAAQEGTAVSATGGSGKSYASDGSRTTNSQGGGGSHTHTLASDAVWRPLYYDVIRATKN